MKGSELWKYMEYQRTIEALREPFLAAPNSFERRKIMAQAYALMLPEIEEAAKLSLGRWTDPYFLEWDIFSTPIGKEAWCCIRSRNVVFYPEYPVLNYFLDFANPILKVGVELDGKQYHDPVKDAVRDANLAKEGWTIYRIPGSECAKSFKDIHELHDMDLREEELQHHIEDWILGTCDGVFEALYWRYFAGDRTSPRSSLHAETLAMHISTKS